MYVKVEIIWKTVYLEHFVEICKINRWKVTRYLTQIFTILHYFFQEKLFSNINPLLLCGFVNEIKRIGLVIYYIVKKFTVFKVQDFYKNLLFSKGEKMVKKSFYEKRGSVRTETLETLQRIEWHIVLYPYLRHCIIYVYRYIPYYYIHLL